MALVVDAQKLRLHPELRPPSLGALRQHQLHPGLGGAEARRLHPALLLLHGLPEGRSPHSTLVQTVHLPLLLLPLPHQVTRANAGGAAEEQVSQHAASRLIARQTLTANR